MGTESQRVEPLAGERWVRHRALSWMLRAVVLLVPLGASVMAGVVLSRSLPVPGDGLETVAWFAAIFVPSMGVLIVADRVARRLLPLAVLLRLSLVFPDRAPSRFSVALRAGSTRRLAALAAEVGHQDRVPGAETVVTLASALNAHDRRTRGHSERVRALTDLLVEELGLTEHDGERLRWAAFLHDIGKLSVSTRVLNKPGRPNPREWRQLQGHPAEGERLAGSLRPWLGEWLHAIGHHHEKFDGSGYPAGLAGRDIPLSGRIVAVTDAFETMTAVRSYSKPKSVRHARSELTRCAGSHFDPRVVRAFLGISLGRLRWTLGLASWVAQLPLVGLPARVNAQIVTTAAGVEANTGIVGTAAVALASVATPLTPALWAMSSTPAVASTASRSYEATGAVPVTVPAATTSAASTDPGLDPGHASAHSPSGQSDPGAAPGGAPGAGTGPAGGNGSSSGPPVTVPGNPQPSAVPAAVLSQLGGAGVHLPPTPHLPLP
jgi:hypothetical protein